MVKPDKAAVERTDAAARTDRLLTDTFVAQSFATFLAETSLGPQVQIEVEDVHGNRDVVAQRGPNAFAKAAKLIDDLGGDRLLPAKVQKLGAVGVMAALSGFTYYIGSTVDQAVSGVKFAVDVLRGKVDVDLSEFYDSLAYLADNPEVLAAMPKAIAKSALRAQNLQNPFPAVEFPDRGDPFSFGVANVTFAGGWYAGAVLGLAAEAVVTGGAGTYAKAIGKGLPVVNRVIKAGETASSLVSGAVGVGKRTALVGARGVADATGLAVDALTDALGRLSVAKQFVVGSRVTSLDASVTDLAKAEGLDRGLVAALDFSDNAAVRMLNDLDDDTRARLLRVANCRVGGATLNLAMPVGGAGFVGTSDAFSVGSVQVDAFSTAGGCAGFPDEESFRRGFKNVYEAYDSGDLSEADVDQLSRRLADDDTDVVARTLADGGANGARLIATTDNLGTVKRFVSSAGVRSDAVTLIQRFDDAGSARKFFSVEERVDVEFTSFDQWRSSVADAVGEDEITTGDVLRYWERIDVVVDRDNVQNYDSFFREVADNPEQLLDSANEVDRAAYYAERRASVTVEPDSEGKIDLKTEDASLDEYIELKQTTGTFDERKISDLLFGPSGSDTKFGTVDIDTSDGQTALEIRIRNPGESIDLSDVDAKSYEQYIESRITSVTQIRKENGKDVLTDEVRVYLGLEDKASVTVKTTEVNP